jgi:hypothetical protein
MRKLVLLLLCIALFSYCPTEKNYPLIDLITTNQVMDDVKQLFQRDKHDELSHDHDGDSQNSIAKLFDKATQSFTDNISEPIRQALQGDIDPVEEKKEQQVLDLSLPDLDEGDFSSDFNPQLGSIAEQHENSLPDLFSAPDKSNKANDSRASIGGRLLIDEQNPNYTMDSVLGAEVSLELKTH